MAATLKAVRGTRDLLPPETGLWSRVETTARAVFARYNFGEIRTPIFETTELFVRGVGEETDVVSKEMYTWEDRGRFDKDALKDVWRRENSNSTATLLSQAYSAVDLVLEYPDGTIKMVIFAEKALKADYDLLHIEIIKVKSSSEQTHDVRGLIVVPRDAHTDKIPPDFRWEIDVRQITGNFYHQRQQLTLRPENTAGVVRAYIEHKLGDTGHLQKLFYIGPQFRRERPQRGRYRQFWQIGAEVLGPPTSGAESPLRDAEVLEMLATLLDELGIRGWQLALNSVGSATDRPRYLAALREALAPIKATLCQDCQRRAETNPLRVLDCKVPEDQPTIDTLPRIADFLDPDSTAHFAQVRAALDTAGVPYTLSPRLVRGLDYYTRTTFEFTVPSGAEAGSGLGTQNALLGGGRYDGLSEMLGGPRVPGIGFAIGEDRLILTLQAQQPDAATVPKLDAYIAPIGPEQNPAALALARDLRRQRLTIELGDGTFRLKKSFEAAERTARHILLLGEDEAASEVFTVKHFASNHQTHVPRASLAELLKRADPEG